MEITGILHGNYKIFVAGVWFLLEDLMEFRIINSSPIYNFADTKNVSNGARLVEKPLNIYVQYDGTYTLHTIFIAKT